MSALTAEQRERVQSAVRLAEENHNWPAVSMPDLRALLADSDALAAAERERDEANAACRGVRRALDRSIAQVATLREALEQIAGPGCEGYDFEIGKPLGPCKCMPCVAVQALRDTAPEHGQQEGA